MLCPIPSCRRLLLKYYRQDLLLTFRAGEKPTSPSEDTCTQGHLCHSFFTQPHLDVTRGHNGPGHSTGCRRVGLALHIRCLSPETSKQSSTSLSVPALNISHHSGDQARPLDTASLYTSHHVRHAEAHYGLHINPTTSGFSPEVAHLTGTHRFLRTFAFTTHFMPRVCVSWVLALAENSSHSQSRMDPY